MWKKVLGWVLFFGGIFCGIAGIGSSVKRYPIVPTSTYHSHYEINFVVMAFWVTVAVALIWGGWKLAHSKK
jgi:hypothetical protein